MAFGGGTVTALVIGDRRAAPLAILSSNDVAVLWTAAWWLLNYSPLSSVLLSLLDGFLPLRVASKACVNVLRAQLISARVDFAVKAFPGVVAAPLLLGEFYDDDVFFEVFSVSPSPLFSPNLLISRSLSHTTSLLFLFSPGKQKRKTKQKTKNSGTLAGGAGKMTTDPLLAAAGHPPSPAAEFASPGFSLRSAALGAAWQAAAAHWIGFISPRQAGAALVAVLVLHGAAVDVHSWWLEGESRRTFDFTAGPAGLLHAVSRVPAPSIASARGGGGGEKERTPAPSAATTATATTRARSASRKKSA